MLLVCYNLLNSKNIPTYQSLTAKNVGNKDNSDVAKTAAEVVQKKKSNNQPMVHFSHNGNEIITWIASKPKAQNPKQHF